MKKYALIVAGGSGSRMESDIPKQFIEICGKPILMHTINRFFEFDHSIEFIIVLPETQIDFWSKLCKKHKFNIKHKIAKGGKTRFHSVKNGLNNIEGEGIVAIHDGVRPLVNTKTIERCFDTAEKKGNAIPCMNIIESVRQIENKNDFPVDRSKFVTIQTPQVFKIDLIKKAHEQEYLPEFTDDATALEKLGIKINLVEGNIENIKITTNYDLIIAKTLLKITNIRTH